MARSILLAIIPLLILTVKGHSQQIVPIPANRAEDKGIDYGPPDGQNFINAYPNPTGFIALGEQQVGRATEVTPALVLQLFHQLWDIHSSGQNTLPELVVRNTIGNAGIFLTHDYAVYCEKNGPGVTIQNLASGEPALTLPPIKENFTGAVYSLAVSDIGIRPACRRCLQIAQSDIRILNRFSAVSANGENYALDGATITPNNIDPFLDHKLGQPIGGGPLVFFANHAALVDQPGLVTARLTAPHHKIFYTFQGTFFFRDKKLRIRETENPGAHVLVYKNGVNWGYIVGNSIHDKKPRKPRPIGRVRTRLRIAVDELTLFGTAVGGGLFFKATKVLRRFIALPRLFDLPQPQVPVGSVSVVPEDPDYDDALITSGTVEVNVDGNISQYKLDENGVVLFNIPPTLGTHTVSARFLGNSDGDLPSDGDAQYEIEITDKLLTDIDMVVPSTIHQGSGSLVTATVATDDGSMPSGIVTLKCVGPIGISTLTAMLDSNGVATFDVSNLSPGDYDFHCYFDTQGDYLGISGAHEDVTIVGSQIGTATKFSSFPAGPITAGDSSQTCTVQVTASDNSSLTGRKVELEIFNSAGSSWGESPFVHTLDNNGQSMYTLDSLPADTYTLRAHFPAQDSYDQSWSEAQTLVVNPKPTTGNTYATNTDLSVPALMFQGDPTAFAVGIVTYADSGRPVPDGIVVYFSLYVYDDQFGAFDFAGSGYSTTGAGVAGFGYQPGQAPMELEYLDVGTWYIQATTIDQYFFNDHYLSSQSDLKKVVVEQSAGPHPQPAPPPTTTMVSKLPDTMTQGDPVKATVTVAPGAGVLTQFPSGQVLLDFSGFRGSPFAHTLDKGQTTYDLSSLTPGIYQVQATYPDQNGFKGSVSDKQTIKVLAKSGGVPVATSITLNAPASITVGDPNAIATVTVAAADGSTPSGQVGLTFSGFNNNQPFWHTLDGTGSTQFTLGSLPLGTYTLQAEYPAQGNYAASQSGTQSLKVLPQPSSGPVATTVALSVPPSIAVGDSSARAVVSVTAADGSVPTGTVQLCFSGFGTFPHNLDSTGSTAYTLDSLPAGTYQLQATYPPQGNYQGSQSDVKTLVVGSQPAGPVGTSITIKVPDAIARGDRTVVAHVVVSAADGSIPSGTVTMTYDGPWAYNGHAWPHPLAADGSTDFTLWSLPPGTYKMIANYAAQGNYAASQATATLVVQ